MTDSRASSKILYIFRHGETDWNRDSRMQGGVDIPLNEAGRAQALRLREFFIRQPVDVVLTSDLSRARQTAEIALGHLNIPMVVEPRIRETNLGDAEGLSHDEFIERFGEDLLEEWRKVGPDGRQARFPGGESKAEHLARVLQGLQDFLHSTSHRRIAVSTHGGSIRRLLHHLRPELEQAVIVGNCVTYETQYDMITREWSVNLTPVCGDKDAIERAYAQMGLKRSPIST